METLVLNAGFEPLEVIKWQRAIVLVLAGKAEIVTPSDKLVRSPSVSLPIPLVVRLLRYVRGRYLLARYTSYTRRNVLIRDNLTCCYCARVLSPREATLDHVVPKSRGGGASWTNVVTCCKECNLRKGARTPEEAGMPLLTVPRRPTLEEMLPAKSLAPEK